MSTVPGLSVPSLLWESSQMLLDNQKLSKIVDWQGWHIRDHQGSVSSYSLPFPELQILRER